jgi:Flp pilus assembly protein TadG
MNHLINWGLAVAVAAVLSTGYLLDGPSDHQAAMDAAADAKATQAEQRAQARFERAAQAMCGENAGWTKLENGSVQCFTKRGHKTQKVQL